MTPMMEGLTFCWKGAGLPGAGLVVGLTVRAASAPVQPQSFMPVITVLEERPSGAWKVHVRPSLYSGFGLRARRLFMCELDSR